MSKSIQEIINEQRESSPLKGLDAKTINYKEASLVKWTDRDLRKRASVAQKNRMNDPVMAEKIRSASQAQGKSNAKYFYQGKSTVEWAEEYNCSPDWIRVHLKKYGNLDAIENPPIDPNTMRINGKTFHELAVELNVNPTTIYTHYHKYGNLDNLSNYKKGTREKIVYNGKTRIELAEQFGVTPDTISFHLKKHGHLDNVLNNKKVTTYQGKTCKQLEAEYGVASSTIRKHLKLHGNLDNLKKKQ